MNKATSRGTPPSRKPQTPDLIPDEYLQPRWSNDDLRRVLALSTLGVVLCGAAWLTWRSLWLLWPAGLCALALQISATMIAARAAVEARGERPVHRPAARRVTAPGQPQESLWSLLARLLLPGEEDATTELPEDAATEPVTLALPTAAVSPCDHALHLAFFRRVVDAEFREHAPGLVWPDLGALQGSLATRLRLFPRQPALDPVPASDVSASERSPHSPWRHLAALEAIDYRLGDAMARLSHRAFAPLAFLELHARLDLETGECEALEAELLRQYTVGFGRVLTSPAVLSAAEPLRQRFGGREAIAVADDARLAMRSTSSVSEAERLRAEWHVRARSVRAAVGWSGEVQSLVEGLIDYWLVQRAAAADIEWAEELARLDDRTIGSALAQRDAGGEFQFALALRTVCGGASRPETSADVQAVAPTTAVTVA